MLVCFLKLDFDVIVSVPEDVSRVVYVPVQVYYAHYTNIYIGQNH